ncbi:hypothetical protein [Marmoricola sp. RAF53]|uniref:hypothetical protein n=1 Tax=Marmoricola sp. RAF53 TaxID=3233059 RepID=UPI003F9AFBF2
MTASQGVNALDTFETDARGRRPEVGAWSLEYLGPGFRVQLRIASHGRAVELSGWMSPAPEPGEVVTVRLLPLTHGSRRLHRAATPGTVVCPSGRFELSGVPAGACRLTFVLPSGATSTTPPFWV